MKRNMVTMVMVVMAGVVATVGAAPLAVDDVVFVNDAGGIYIRDGETLGSKEADNLGVGLTGAAVQSSGRVVVSSSAGGVYIRDGQTLGSVQTDSFGGGAATALSVQGDDDVVLSQYDGATGTLRIRDGQTLGGVAYDASPAFGDITSLAIMPQGDVVFGNAAGDVYVRDGQTLGSVAVDNFGGGGITALGMQSDGDMVTAEWDGGTATVRIRSVSGTGTGGVAVAEVGNQRITSIGVLSNDDIVLGMTGGYLYVRSGQDLSAIVNDSFGGGDITSVAIQSDDDIFLTQYDGVDTTLRLRRISGSLTSGLAADTGGFGNVTAAAVQIVPEPATVLFILLTGLVRLARRR